jgi:hypothetical protein
MEGGKISGGLALYDSTYTIIGGLERERWQCRHGLAHVPKSAESYIHPSWDAA